MKKPGKKALFLTLAALLCAGGIGGAFALFRARPAGASSANASGSASAGSPSGGASASGAASDILNLLSSSSQAGAVPSASSSSASASSAAQADVFDGELIPDFLSAGTGYLEVNQTSFGGAIPQHLLFTENGGKTWSLRSREDLTQLSFVSVQTGYAVRETGTGPNASERLVKTTDGGASWKAVSSLPKLTLSSVCAVGKSTVYAESSSDEGNSRLLRSSDGGKTWADVALPAWPKNNLPGARTQFTSSWAGPSQGYLLELGDSGAGSTEKALFATENGGKTWAPRAKALFNSTEGGEADSLPLSGIAELSCFLPDGTGYLVDAGGLVRTSDGGVHYMPVCGGSYAFPVFSHVCFYSANGGFAMIAQESGEINFSRTADGGRTWKSVATGAALAKLLGLE